MSDRFQVDLAGLVDLLSRHLYSGPHIFLRELLQNAADAVAARRLVEPDCPATIRLVPEEDPPRLTIVDTGVGMTCQQAIDLLATIGRSSKRDDLLGEGRAEFMGQFGIGLLASFLVADQIEVLTRAVDSSPVRWVGRADGTFAVEEIEEDRPVGTEIRLVARPDAASWVDHATVVALASEFGALLPVDVAVEVPVGVGRAWRRTSLPEAPWLSTYDSPRQRQQALVAWCESTLGFTPLASIDLKVPVTGTSGVAFVLPQPVAPGQGRHRVYVKDMLVDSSDDTILPPWAFFARAVVTSQALSPTASREQLREDQALLMTREALGQQIKTWIQGLVERPGPLRDTFLRVHHLAVRSMALVDDDMLEVAAAVLPYETSQGSMTLAEVAAGEGRVTYAPTVEAYRRVAPVARAQGLVVVNAGYVYDADLLDRLGAKSGWQVEALTSAHVAQRLGLPSEERERAASEALMRARGILANHDCDVLLRTFDPDDVPAVLLHDPEAERRRDLDRERAATPDLWAGLLDSFASAAPTASRTLVLNDANEMVALLLSAPRATGFEPGCVALYLSAVMASGEPLRRSESSVLSLALGELLRLSFSPRSQE